MSEINDLFVCPHCDGCAQYFDSNGIHKVSCNSCFVSTPHKNTRDKAIDSWGRKYSYVLTQQPGVK